MNSPHCATRGKANPYALKSCQQPRHKAIADNDCNNRMDRHLNDDSLEPITCDLAQVLLVLGDVPAQLIDYLL